jgi:F420-dependent oxidoreductase-like protein
MRIGLMIEGQNGLNWPRWKAILQAADELGFAHVFRSDHITNPSPPDLDSLECWSSLVYAAGHTQRIEFGPLVSPVTFRHPSMLTRVAAAVDDLSGGRLTFGIGAGWQDREHHNFGIPFPSTETRLEMLEEYAEVTRHLLRSDQPTSFSGKYCSLDDAILLPRPSRPGGPPILIGGNGKKRTMPMAAKYADEWNGVSLTPQAFRERSAHLDTLLQKEGRSPDSMRRSVMVGSIFGADQQALQKRLAAHGTTLEEAQGEAIIAGTPDMWIERLRAYRDAGVERIMVQWLDLDDLAGIETVAREVLPAFH